MDGLGLEASHVDSNSENVAMDPTITLQPEADRVALTLKFSFPGTIRPQDGNEKIEDLSRRLGKRLPDYLVKVSKQFADLSYTGQLTDETGFTANKRKADEVYTGEILIQRDVVNAANAGTQ